MQSTPKRSALISGLLHAGAIVLVLIATRYRPQPQTDLRVTPLVFHDISRYVPRLAHDLKAGGGGGKSDLTQASAGHLPKIARIPFTPPAAVYRNVNPLLAMEPAIMGTPQNAPISSLHFGDPNGVGRVPSDGRGKDGGIGDGKGPGVGDHNGPGFGDGDQPGVDGGNTHIVGTTTMPVLLTKTDPEYTDEARRAKLQGVVVLHIDVNAKGLPQNIKVVRSLGLGLDERAVESVQKWTFRAGTINGKPAVTSADVYVTFRLL